MKMIIGLTGPNASGKGEAAEYLINKGYRYSSLSDIIRQEAKKLRIAPTRDNLINLGNAMRRKHGAAVLAKKAKKYLNDFSSVLLPGLF